MKYREAAEREEAEARAAQLAEEEALRAAEEEARLAALAAEKQARAEEEAARLLVCGLLGAPPYGGGHEHACSGV